MARSQPGIFALGGRSQLHLQLDLAGGADGLGPAVAAIREGADGLVGANLVVGFRPSLWAELAPDDNLAGVDDYQIVVGPDGFTMPADQHDLWCWIHGPGPDAVFDVARSITRELAGLATVATEQPTFVYHASQDLTGFEDGTENPPIDEALDVATVGAGQPGAGSSVVLLQRWVHDLDRFGALPVAEQEEVIGRTLADSEELDDERQPPTSHVSRVVIEDDDGDELEVFRRSTAFGGVSEHGLQFVAFSADQDRLQRMLEQMAGVGDGIRDRLTEFSTPTGTAWYVAPPVEALAGLDG